MKKILIFALLFISPIFTMDSSSEDESYAALTFALSKSPSMKGFEESSDEFQKNAQDVIVELSSHTSSEDKSSFVGVLCGQTSFWKPATAALITSSSCSPSDSDASGDSLTGSEVDANFLCDSCNRCLLNISFQYIPADDCTVCIHCAYKWLNRDEDTSAYTESSESDYFRNDLEDDEPLFDHKQGNAKARQISRFHKSLRSARRTLYRTPKPLTRKQLKHLQQLQDPR